jgi:hypothetical protein
MTIFRAVRQLWARAEASPEDRNKILKERIANLFNEANNPQESSRVEHLKKVDQVARLARDKR